MAQTARSNAELSLAAAKADLERVEASLGVVDDNNPAVRTARANLEKAEFALASTTVVAPTDGYVTNVTLTEGQFVAAVYIPVMIFVLLNGDTNLMILPIMLLFICAEPGVGRRMHQVIDRGGGTLIGGLLSAGVLALYHVLPEVPVVIALCTLVTYFLIDKMTTGAKRPLYYQYICSTAIVMILSSTYGSTARDALEVVLQRVAMTSGAVVIGIVALAILEALFLPQSESREPATAAAVA